MESNLAKQLGMTKEELHDAIAKHTILGNKIDPETNKVVYESISDISDYQQMISRIHEFQQWAASEFNYTFEPLKTDSDDLLERRTADDEEAASAD
jgi:HD superfamily phosphohydrolase YqeK